MLPKKPSSRTHIRAKRDYCSMTILTGLFGVGLIGVGLMSGWLGTNFMLEAVQTRDSFSGTEFFFGAILAGFCIMASYNGAQLIMY